MLNLELRGMDIYIQAVTAPIPNQNPRGTHKHINISVSHNLAIRRNNLVEARAQRLVDIFILMRQERQGIGHIVPLSLCFAAGESSSEFLGQLPGMFLL